MYRQERSTSTSGGGAPISSPRAQFTRRRFGAIAATSAAGSAALALVGCGNDGGDSDSPAAATPAVMSGGTQQAGGTYRQGGASNTWDTFDIDRSRFSPLGQIYGRTNNGIVEWKSYARAQIEGGFASSWQQPDRQTLVLTLRDGLVWHDKPPVNGRAATAEDMAAFIMRNKAGTLLDGAVDPTFYRTTFFRNVEAARVVDPRTVQVTFARPDPFFLNTLAGAFSKVMAPEAIRQFEGEFSQPRADHVIGTAGFVLSEFSAGRGCALPALRKGLAQDMVRWRSLGALVHGPGGPAGTV